MKTVIKKIIQLIIFLILFLLILLVDFAIYKNINRIIPTHQNEIYAFENKIKQGEEDFLSEVKSQIEQADNYKEILDNAYITQEKTMISNIINNYIYYIEEKIGYPSLYSGKLENTIYGDLNFITSITYKNKKGIVYIDFYVAYSDDMKKICYYDMSRGLIQNNQSIYENIYDVDGEKSEEEYKELAEATKNKDEIIKSAKDSFSKIIPAIDIKPSTIIKKVNYYILQDEENDLTIYYDNDNNVIFGFYMGFDK